MQVNPEAAARKKAEREAKKAAKAAEKAAKEAAKEAAKVGFNLCVPCGPSLSMPTYHV